MLYHHCFSTMLYHMQLGRKIWFRRKWRRDWILVMLASIRQNLPSSRLLSKNLKIKVYETTVLPAVLYGCEIWSPILREEHRLRVIDALWDFVPCSYSSREVLEIIGSIFRVPWCGRIPQLCYRGNTVYPPLHRETLFVIEDHCLLRCLHRRIRYRYLMWLRVLEDMALRRVFGPKRNEVTGG
jgi:hypothetical protein